MGNIVPLLSASWRPLGAGKGWILKATSTLRKFTLLKSHGLSELENNSTSTFGQKIFLALLLMVTYVKYLTFVHGMLSLLNQCSTPFLTAILHFPGYYVTAAQALVHVSHQRIQTKVLLPHRTPVYIPTIPRYIDACLSRHLLLAHLPDAP